MQSKKAVIDIVGYSMEEVKLSRGTYFDANCICMCTSIVVLRELGGDGAVFCFVRKGVFN